MNINYNLCEIRRLLVDFHMVTGVRVAVFDENVNEIDAYPDRLSGFCKFIRDNDQILEKCKSDDLSHFKECKSNKTASLYRCHAGFYEMIMPITLNDCLIGFLMAGQIKCEDFLLENFVREHKDILDESAALKEEFSKLYFTQKEKVVHIKNMLSVYSQHICNSAMMTVDETSLSYQIDSYILNNLSQDFDVDSLCKVFNYHKTTFYKITKRLFGTSIMQHIKQLRIFKAKSLLINTNLKINEIAYLVGVPDYNYFTKVFKSEAHCTPREFRKNNGMFAN